MDTRSKHMKTGCLRKSVNLGSKLRWRLVRVFAEEGEGLKHCRASAVNSKVRRYLRREEKRARLAQCSPNVNKTETKESLCDRSFAEARVHLPPPGAMAPENTTQYLMSNVYEDMKTSDVQTVFDSYENCSHVYGESLSPSSVFAALDSGYESCLAFQQRDFEEVFELCL